MQNSALAESTTRVAAIVNTNTCPIEIRNQTRPIDTGYRREPRVVESIHVIKMNMRINYGKVWHAFYLLISGSNKALVMEVAVNSRSNFEVPEQRLEAFPLRGTAHNTDVRCRCRREICQSDKLPLTV
jgi:hypothetical protein